MKSWSRKLRSEDPDSVVGSSSSERNSISEPPVPRWVTHTPTPDNTADVDVDHASSSSQYEEKEKKDSMKQRLKSLLPQSWRGLVHKQTGDSDSLNDSEGSIRGIKILPNGTRVSPPVSPILERRHLAESLYSSSQNSHKPLLRESPSNDVFNQGLREESLLTNIHPAEYYAEKLEVYNQKYSYLKSWPGLLRLLGGFQLLFGGMVFACVISYVHKDSEWTNTYGFSNYGQGLSGYSYKGPMTPFTLAVAGLSWIITLILFVMGMTMYYRTILLDAPWWPLTEAFVNMTLFLLYMAAGIVYLNDLNRGGLCNMIIGVNPILSNMCRVDGGQMAGIAFVFINMVMYLGSFVVCLKMWRHEAARREREYYENQPQEEFHQSIPLTHQKTKGILFEDETDYDLRKDVMDKSLFNAELKGNPVSRVRGTGSEYIPRVHVIADYIIKYPEISCVEDREKYKAVFNDQYQEYNDLHKDVSITLNKFRELDAMMEKLLRDGKSHQNQQRIDHLLKTFQQKKNDPAFLEKKQRCDYLKAKLSHIKKRIRTFDQETTRND